jgi:hypothetical protein
VFNSSRVQLIGFKINPVLLLHLTSVQFRPSLFTKQCLMSTNPSHEITASRLLKNIKAKRYQKKSEYTSSCTFHFINTYSVQPSPKRSIRQYFSNFIPSSTLILHRIFSSKSPLPYLFTSFPADITPPPSLVQCHGGR